MQHCAHCTPGTAAALHQHSMGAFSGLTKYQIKKKSNFFFSFTYVWLTKSLAASIPLQDDEVVVMAIVGHLSGWYSCV